ncbi:ribbon-helix-helix protein, CopG family [Galactobacter sp.]|uniref:ribbon-helix-helix protein, CopG family n=1 Tax=Galactobacter sp. TaxID=2676125 RepID=UPI0025C44D6E|nr:ribbon-helix-helix protein, CopG family [Galactobacter sp.]
MEDEPDGWFIYHAMTATTKVLIEVGLQSRRQKVANYTDVNGVPFTDEDIERWAAVDESEEGYTGEHLGPSRPGRPVSVGADVRPVTVRLDASRRAKLEELARDHQTSISQAIRELIDAI